MSIPAHLRHFHYDPATGRELTAAERAEKYSQIRFDQTPGDAGTLPGTYQERQEFRRQQTNTDLVVRQRVAEQERLSRGERNVFRDRAEALRESGQAKSHVQYYELAADKLDNERAAQKKAAEYQGSKRVKLMLDNAQAIEQSHKHLWPTATTEEVAYVVSLARSTEFGSIDAHADAYWTATYEIEQRMAAREEALLAEKAAATEFSVTEHLAQKQRADEAKARLDVAVQHLGGQAPGEATSE